MITVVFLLVVLSSTAAFIMDISALQQQGANLSLLESKAQLAAESALEWEGYRILAGEETCKSETILPRLHFTEAGLRGFKADISVHCQLYGTGKRSYTIKSKGSFAEPGHRLYVSRSIRARLSDED